MLRNAVKTILAVMIWSPGFGAVADLSRPNVVFILVDDLAWADLGCYGHPWHQTPHIDRLATRGMRFTNGYAPAPICSASRASILTGKTTARLNFEFVTKDAVGHQPRSVQTPLLTPPYTLNLELNEQTIAECLRDLGYKTAFFGKWHLNAHHRRYLGWSPTHGPHQQGFETAVEDYGSHPYSWGKRRPASIDQSGNFPDDSMVNRTCDFIEGSHDRPFFLMMSQFYVHTPVQTPCRWLIDKYEPLIPAHAPLRAQRIRYAAFVETLDHFVGQVLAAIDRSESGNETLVVFLSDNGGHPGMTANAPLRGSKWNLYEGGIRVPMLVRWPNRIKPRSVCDVPIIGYDLLATLTEIAGKPLQGTDGTSFLGVLNGEPTLADRALVWHFPYYHPEEGFADAPEHIDVDDFATSRTRPQSAIRFGRYKLLKFYEDDRVELYDLENDPSEQRDLSQVRADLALQMRQRLDGELAAMNARLPTILATAE